MVKGYRFDYKYKAGSSVGRTQRTIRTDSEYAARRQLEQYHANRKEEVISIYNVTITP